MDECSNCSFVLLPGERTCPECGFGGAQWSPDDNDDGGADPGVGRAFAGP